MSKGENNKTIVVNRKPNIELMIIGLSDDAIILEKSDAAELGEYRYQLLEGSEYQFKLTDGYFISDNEIINHDVFHKSEGRIKTGIYVGTLKLKIFKSSDANNNMAKPVCVFPLEIRSRKVDYDTDYKRMLEDITEDYTELVMMQGSPVTQHFRQDNKGDAQTDYQRFAFVKSIIESDQFAEAMHQIQASPIRRWAPGEEEVNINNVKRLDPNGIRQILSAHNRVELPMSHPLRRHLTTVPRKINVNFNKETLDTPKNRFIKFVLSYFVGFCSFVSQKKSAKERLKKEAEVTIKRLNNFLNMPVFRSVTQPTSLQLNSPVLQRKEGYREVLQAWLMFDLAANLSWKGAPDVYGFDYDAGMKNVAALYEYWLYFKMIDVVSSVFHLTPRSLSELVTTDEDKLVLDLKEGKMKVVEGSLQSKTRTINVRLYYNRTFSHQRDLSKAGTWTLKMRPDYTLSIWTGNISEEDAESQDTIVHLHFDAKYRLHDILLSDDDNKETEEDLTEEKRNEEKSIYKRADLLKMHAYKDAIRRTSGAYILYPGNQQTPPIKNYHEIIPGLGAFCIRPMMFDQDRRALQKFIKDVVNNFLNRISQREQMAYYQFKVAHGGEKYLKDELPEPEGENRGLLPNETNVLIGYLPAKNSQWVSSNHKYNIPLFSKDGSLALTSKMMSAKYLVLYTNDPLTSKIYRVTSTPKVCTKKELQQKGYPSPKHQAYLVYEFENPDKELKDDLYDIRLLASPVSHKPFAISLAELMKAKVKR